MCSARAPHVPLWICALATLIIACGDSSGTQESSAPPLPLVEAIETRRGALPLEEVVPGVVRARNQVAIRPEISGRVVEVLVRSGEAVSQGQALVRLDDSETRERLRQAEADVRLEQAAAAAARARVAEREARVARTRALAEQELVSTLELETLEAQLAALQASADEAEARVEQAQAAVEERRSALEKTVVRAPVEGKVGDRRAEVGMLVDPSNVLFLVGDLDELIVEVNLTEEMLSSVHEGLPVVIEPRTSTSPVLGELSRISPFLAEESFTTLGEIDVDNREGRLRPGMFVTVRILVGESQQATLIPISAIWEEPGTAQSIVFVVLDPEGLESPTDSQAPTGEQERTTDYRVVEVLAEGRGAAGVTGLEEGDWVVTVGQHLLNAERRSLAASSGATGDSPPDGVRARIRPVSWAHVLELQDLQDEDLLEGFLEKQRLVAAALGAEIPDSEDAVDQVLEQAAARPAEAN